MGRRAAFPLPLIPLRTARSRRQPARAVAFRPLKNPLAVAIFARAPEPGRVNTRLIPLLGKKGAADFQAALISDSIRKVQTLPRSVSRHLFLTGEPRPPASIPRGYTIERQRGADLGARLASVFRKLLQLHAQAVVIGTDSPLLSPAILRQALLELGTCDAVLGPCPDGGYYLIGLRQVETGIPRGLFRNIRWCSAFAFRDTLRKILRSNLSCSVLEPLGDVDRPEDFRQLAGELTRNRAARRLAPATWKFLKGRS